MAKKNFGRDNKKENKRKESLYSSLSQHKREGGLLVSPFNASSSANMNWVSWRDEGLNEVIWAVLIRGNTEQDVCLTLFRDLLSHAYRNVPDRKETFVTHSVISTMSSATFDVWVTPLLAHKEAAEALRALLFFECLPDRHHWARHLEQPDPNVHSNYIMRAFAKCIDHQSQEATDVRWLKYVYLLTICERITFALPDQERSRQMVDEIRYYPNYGDQRAVRPSIRAAEIAFRGLDEKSGVTLETPPSLADKVPKSWSSEFWQECLTKTECILPEIEIPVAIDRTEYVEKLLKIYQALAEHFSNTLENTQTDARRDATFGIALYAIVFAVGLQDIHQRAEARVVLRTIVECYITLKFLVKHDNITMWTQFRNYGTGQSKLAFLKNIHTNSLPGFLNLQDLENYANEDIWQEFLNINIKSWSDRNLRTMSQEAGVKDLYDNYYDWSSGYVHGQWGAIRDTVFTLCLNPLHRLHRVPNVPRFNMPSALPDAVKIINLLLDLVSGMYPPFRLRFKYAKVKDEPAESIELGATPEK